jgi:hypothetical protein
MSDEKRENNLADEKELFDINLPPKTNTKDNEKTDLILNDISVIKKDIDKLYGDMDNKLHEKIDNQLELSNNHLELSNSSINLIIFLIVLSLVIVILLMWFFIKNYYYNTDLNQNSKCNCYKNNMKCNCFKKQYLENLNSLNSLSQPIQPTQITQSNNENQNEDKNNYINLDYSDVNTKLYDYHDEFPHKNTVFVSSIHEYYPPFTKVIQDGESNYIPIHNSKKGYFEQMKKFR